MRPQRVPPVPGYRQSTEKWREEIVRLLERDQQTRAKIEYLLLRKTHPDYKPEIDVPWEDNSSAD